MALLKRYWFRRQYGVVAPLVYKDQGALKNEGVSLFVPFQKPVGLPPEVLDNFSISQFRRSTKNVQSVWDLHK